MEWTKESGHWLKRLKSVRCKSIWRIRPLSCRSSLGKSMFWPKFQTHVLDSAIKIKSECPDGDSQSCKQKCMSTPMRTTATTTWLIIAHDWFCLKSKRICLSLMSLVHLPFPPKRLCISIMASCKMAWCDLNEDVDQCRMNFSLRHTNWQHDPLLMTNLVSSWKKRGSPRK